MRARRATNETSAVQSTEADTKSAQQPEKDANQPSKQQKQKSYRNGYCPTCVFKTEAGARKCTRLNNGEVCRWQLKDDITVTTLKP